MRLLLPIILAGLLSACGHTRDVVKPETVMVKQIEYVIKIPPKELLEIPTPVKDIDVDTAKQSDVARWLLANEERMKQLENMIIGIAKFFKTEQDKLNKQAEEENKKALEKSIDEQANFATDAINKPTKK
jgi:hypothetical protein